MYSNITDNKYKKKNKNAILALFLINVGLIGCTAAERDKLGSYVSGEDFRVEVMGCNGPLRVYQSEGKVESESSSDGYFFIDKATGELTEVSGTVVITKCTGCPVPEQIKIGG